MRALIDTCIVMDVLQNRDNFNADAQKIFLAAANKWFVGFLMVKTVTDLYELIHRYMHSDKDTRGVLDTLFHLFELADMAGMDCKRALQSDVPDYADAVMIEAAARMNMDCIVTHSGKDFSKSQVPVYSPAEFLNRIDQQEEENAEI